MALDTVRANKLRSLLTILGVSVGVVTVVFMVSIIQGLNKAFAEQIEALGSNSIWATKFEPSFGHQPNSEELHRKELTLEDADAIRREAPSALSVSPSLSQDCRDGSLRRQTERHADSARRHAVLRVHAIQLCRARPLHHRSRCRRTLKCLRGGTGPGARAVSVHRSAGQRSEDRRASFSR